MSVASHRLPLSRYGSHALHSQREAAAYCDEVFKGFQEFSFDCNEGDRFLCSGVVRTRKFRLAAAHSSGHCISLKETDSCAVLVPLRGEIRIASGKEERLARPGQGIIALPGERTTHVAPDYLGLVNVISKPRLAGDGRVLLPASGELSSFVRYMVDAFDHGPALAANAKAHTAMAQLLAQLVAQSVSQSGDRDMHCTDALERHVKRAEEWIEAHAGDMLSVADLAAYLGITTRTVQAAFKRHRGCTPRQMMERHRLERVRFALLHAGPGSTVASIALENGVIHLGRFATSYRTRFGEYPSDTLARSSNR